MSLPRPTHDAEKEIQKLVFWELRICAYLCRFVTCIAVCVLLCVCIAVCVLLCVCSYMVSLRIHLSLSLFLSRSLFLIFSLSLSLSLSLSRTRSLPPLTSKAEDGAEDKHDLQDAEVEAEQVHWGVALAQRREYGLHDLRPHTR